jgi:hypothetical protein
MGQKDVLLLAGAGALAWYVWQRSDAKKNLDASNAVSRAAQRAGITIPSGAQIQGVVDDVTHIVNTVKGIFQHADSGAVVTGGSAIWDSYGSVGLVDLVHAPVGDPLTRDLAGYPGARTTRLRDSSPSPA